MAFRRTCHRDPPTDKPLGSGIRSFEIPVVFCQQSTLIDRELLKVLNAYDVPFHEVPQKSVRQRSRELRITKTTFHNVLHKRLHLHAYQLQLLQQITGRRQSATLWFFYLCSGSASKVYGLFERSYLLERSYLPHQWRGKQIQHVVNLISHRNYPACQWVCKNQCLVWLAP